MFSSLYIHYIYAYTHIQAHTPTCMYKTKLMSLFLSSYLLPVTHKTF